MNHSSLHDEIADLTAPAYRSCSVSREGEVIEIDREKILSHYNEPISNGGFRWQLYRDFYETLAKYDMQNISNAEKSFLILSIQNACKFIKTIPKYKIDPEISIDPDFGVIFDWSASRFKNFSAIIGSGRYVNYAGIHGSSVQHGKEILNEKFPESFDIWIKRIN